MSFIQGKVALVTGGAGGIGLCLVEKLLENGAKGVSSVDVQDETPAIQRLKKQYNGKVIYLKADITVAKELEDAFVKTINEFKNLDIVANNAGIINELQWEKMVEVNVNCVIQGTYLAMDKYLPRHKSGNEGVIVNTASILGINTLSTLPVYCASKHAVFGFCKTLGAQEYYEKNKIRIMAICPGIVKTTLINDPQTRDPKKTIDELTNCSEIMSAPSYLAESIVKLINEGKHGSLWIAEDEKEPFAVVEPHRRDLRK